MKQGQFWCIYWFILLSLPVASWGQGLEQPSGLDPFHLYELRIQFEDKHWENRLKAYKSTDRKDKIPATIFFDNVRVDSVGIRFKGNSSFNSVKKGGSRKLPFSLDAGDQMDGRPALCKALPSVRGEVVIDWLLFFHHAAPRSDRYASMTRSHMLASRRVLFSMRWIRARCRVSGAVPSAQAICASLSLMRECMVVLIVSV